MLKRTPRVIWMLAAILISGGCVTVEHGKSSAYYLGLVRVVRDDQLAETQRFDVSTAGIWIDRGVGVGVRFQHELSMPGKCQIVLFINDEKVLVHALELIALSSTPEGICVESTQ